MGIYDKERSLADLGAADQRTREAAVRDCAGWGPRLLPALAEVLSSGSVSARRGAAQAVGRIGGEDAAAVLLPFVDADDGKLRKNVATALGRAGGDAAVRALAQRLETEELDYVRSAVVLALGRIDAPDAKAALDAFTPAVQSDDHALARAAGDRQDRPAIGFVRSGRWAPRVRLTVPRGLEDAVADEVRALGFGAVASEESVAVADGVPPWSVWPAVRGAHAVRVCADGDPETAIPALLATLGAVDGTHYRVHADGPRRTRAEFRSLLARLRRLLRPLGLTDQPSAYDFQIVLTTDNTFELEPSFLGDDRFAYRQRDVGASIQPVVAATLARLVATGPNATVHDPTCGSATLLIERARLGASALSGTDISPYALGAARTNLDAAGIEATLTLGDSTLSTPWPETVDEVICNLPFGVRTHGDGAEITEGVVRQTAARLRRGGRALFYTSQVDTLVWVLRDSPELTVSRRFDLDSGGIHVVAMLTTTAPR